MFHRLSGERGAALLEYVLILPLVLLLFFGTLEIFRLMSVKQSLRTGLKQAAPCISHWKDYPNRCDPLELISEELAKNPFTVTVHRLHIEPVVESLDSARYGEVIDVIVEAEVEFGFLYPFEGGPTIVVRESVTTFIDSSPEFYELNPARPFPKDPGAVR